MHNQLYDNRLCYKVLIKLFIQAKRRDWIL